MSRRRGAVLVAAALLGLVTCGGCGSPAGRSIDTSDCPGGVSMGAGGRPAGAKGYPTPEEAAEVLRADADMSRKDKLAEEGTRVDADRPDTVRLLYADGSGRLVVQVDVTREGSEWHPDSVLQCHQKR